MTYIRSYGTFIASDLSYFDSCGDSLDIRTWALINDSDDTPLTHLGCFSPYFSWNENGGRKFYFYFPLLMPWAEKLVNEINNRVHNFKYIIHKKTYATIKFVEKDGWGEKYTTSEYSFIDKKEYDRLPDNRKFLGLVLSIEFNPEYTKEAIKYLSYILHHTIRIASVLELYIEPGENPEENFLEFLISKSNEHRTTDNGIKPGGGYRALSENEISVEDFMRFDNIDLANSAFVKQNIDYRQTEIIQALKDMEKISEFKVLQKVPLLSKSGDIYLIIGSVVYLIGVNFNDVSKFIGRYNTSKSVKNAFIDVVDNLVKLEDFVSLEEFTLSLWERLKPVCDRETIYYILSNIKYSNSDLKIKFKLSREKCIYSREVDFWITSGNIMEIKSILENKNSIYYYRRAGVSRNSLIFERHPDCIIKAKDEEKLKDAVDILQRFEKEIGVNLQLEIRDYKFDAPIITSEPCGEQ